MYDADGGRVAADVHQHSASDAASHAHGQSRHAGTHDIGRTQYQAGQLVATAVVGEHGLVACQGRIGLDRGVLVAGAAFGDIVDVRRTYHHGRIDVQALFGARDYAPLLSVGMAQVFDHEFGAGTQRQQCLLRLRHRGVAGSFNVFGQRCLRHK